ncbi:response regulator [Allohahella marinimesophila]|uniref:histidine kinase n=1 Tax=Allohahella marinimesophila TaxID=1054972 RepID=A0ABP7NSM3_9GAMM
MNMSQYAEALILNVDDSDGARYAKSRILKRAGFSVIEARDGEEALAKARSEKPVLILLDVKLPDINGIEVCRQLKSDSETQTILVLQTSASFIGSADRIRALEIGADSYLIEPIEPEELVANVRALLRLGHVERELREVDRRKNEFLATLAHELRNPLGPIRTSVELLRKLDPVVPPMQAKARDTIQRHTDHLALLVDDLLDVARISQGKIALRAEPVPVKGFVVNALDTSRAAITAKGHTLTVDQPEQDVWVQGDQVRLSQILSNLLLNAAKYTPPAGHIELRVTATDNELIMIVSDDGIGIDEASVDSIFNLFSQSDHVRDQVQDGLGIGLSLVRTLVDLHGGSVSVQSAGKGQGSRFEVRLPLAEAGAVPLAEPAEKTVAQVQQRVLIVDDNIDAAEALAQLLELSGHKVQTAFSGQAALDVVAQFCPEFVFLDIGLPDISGYDVAAMLNELRPAMQFIIIALTGYGQSQDRESALEAGCDHHLVKPLDFSMLSALGLNLQLAKA